ncbi:hypothetical protein D0S45_16860 [Marinifilum sp. JC120]|nr:hypothetical protein D0S45_16860 [Marinifilum sp. JC120]
MQNETLNQTEHRILLLRWLSTLFMRELTLKEVENYKNNAGKELLEQFQEAFPEAIELEQIKQLLHNRQPSADTTLDFASAFSWLFHGVGGPKSAPPHQHAWSEASDGTQMQCIDQCLKLMAECKMGLEPCCTEPADHAAIQLEFLAYLEENSYLNPDKSWDEYHEKFIRDHINVWFPQFLNACENNDRSKFYASLASLTRRILQLPLTPDWTSNNAAKAS